MKSNPGGVDEEDGRWRWMNEGVGGMRERQTNREGTTEMSLYQIDDKEFNWSSHVILYGLVRVKH